MRILPKCVLGAAWFAFGAMAWAGGFPSGASTLPLLLSRGTDLVCNQGDWVQCPPPAADVGLPTNKFHSYFVEVPPGTGNLTLELFDADDGAGAGEAAAGRDTAVATAAQSEQYSVLNPAGIAQTVRFARGNGVSATGGVTTGLSTAAGVAVSCTTVGTTTGDNAWCPIIVVANPTAGHWELRVQSVTGTALNYYGVRARDTVTNRDLNVYARSFVHYGNQNVQAGRTYSGSNAFFPYVTEGCQLRAADFDSDNDANETIRYASRTLVFDQTLTDAANGLSGNNTWNDELLTFTTNVAAREYGIWRNECTSGINSANHVTPWLGSEMSAASPPNAQPVGGSDRGTTAVTSGESYRIYFPTNAGAAPLKPFVEQRLFAVVAGTTPTPGATANYRVTISISNPTPYPITFGTVPAEQVTSTIPNDIGAGTTLRNFGFVGGSFSASAGCGTATTPAANASGNVVWNPGTIAAASSCTATYQISLAIGTGVPVGTVVPMSGLTTAGTTAVFLDETGTRFVFGPLCALQVTVGTAVSVPVTVSYFDAEAVGGGRLHVRWRTATEANTLGFSLLEGPSADSAHELGDASTAALGVNSIRAQDYELTVSGYSGGKLWLEERNGSGKTARHGPFVAGRSQGSLADPAPIDWSASRSEQRMAQTAAQQAGRAINPHEVELRVAVDGAYRVRYEDLLAVGSDWNGIPAAQIALLRDGQAQPIAIDGAADFGPGSAIRFVGSARRGSLYSKETVYVLSRDPLRARAMNRINASPAAIAYADSALRLADVAPDSAWNFASPLSDPWYAFALTRSGAARPTGTLNLPLDGLVGGSDATLRATLWGGLDFEEGADHAVSIAFNGQLLATDQFDGLSPRFVDLNLAAGAVHEGDNGVEFALEQTGLPFDKVHVEGARVAYRGYLRAQSDRLDFSAPSAESGDALFADEFGDTHRECATTACVGYELANFSGAPVLVYRLRGDAADEMSTSSAGSTIRIAGAEQPSDRYVAASLTAHRLPSIAFARAPVDLFAGAARYLAIGPASVLPALDPLLAARRAQGLSARAVAIEDIYAQFGDGAVDPEAVRRFVRSAAEQLGTEYVLLAGGDTYDYFNYSGNGSVSLVPTFYRHTHPLLRFGPTDVPYGDIDDDGRLDLSVGRLPARNAAEMALLVGKTLAYENAAPAPALFAADLPGNGSDFGNSSNGFIASLDAQFVATRPPADKIYLGDAASTQAARDALFAALNSGRSLVSYYGHSSPIGWTFSGLLGVGDVSSGLLHNSAAPIVITQWGCWGAFFVDPQYSTLAHGLLIGGADGATALIGATGLTESPHDEALAALLLPLLSAPHARLGDALRQAQSSFAASHPEALDVSLGTVLLGDPALVLNH